MVHTQTAEALAVTARWRSLLANHPKAGGFRVPRWELERVLAALAREAADE